jgi:hypothetical protein
MLVVNRLQGTVYPLQLTIQFTREG